jgi:DNA adenine methylase
MKAPIGRTGGKSKLKNQLIPLFPKDYDTFVEPFVGAGSIFYSTPRVKNEIINDLDTDMYIIHSGLQQDAKYINDNIIRDFSQTEFDKAKNKNDVLSLIYKYKASFLTQGKCFNKLERIGMKIDFTPFQERLKGVTILNKDFSDVIKEYDNSTAFFYLDPPYITKVKYYDNNATPENIYKSLQGLKGKFMLSYNDNPNVRKVFNEYNITELKTNYQSAVINKHSGIMKRTELVITNY